ncbi:MAG TPA: ABC transporter permease [Bryobacteraceae bacterium]|nr:ABC transporter permease [Bryobacteraceae bacterium]
MSIGDRFLWDARVGLRGLLRQRGFTAVAVGSLALGIAAATAMYSVIHAVVLDPFPYKDVDSLTSIRVFEPGRQGGRTYYTVDQYLEFRERSRIFHGVIASTISDVVWTRAGEPQRLRGNHGPFDTFEVMGVGPLAGRLPTATDAQPGAPPVAVLGYRFWQRQFGGDRRAIGRQMVLNGVVRTVIGVMPPRFMWRGADVYLPTHFRRGEAVEGVRSVHVLGRLKPGISAAHAEGDLKPIIEDLARREPQSFPEKWRVALLPFKETFPSGLRSALFVLFGATGLLLLIACANVSNLLLFRAAGRQREMAIRASMGAGRWRLIRQLLTESLLLASAAGAVGIALAYALLRSVIAIVPPDTIPDEAQVAMNVPVLLFTVAVSAATALLFGLAPALHGCVPNLVESLKSGTRTAGGDPHSELLRGGLVVAEVALALMLLAGSALMLRTLLRLTDADLGFRPERVLAMRVPLPETRYPDAARRNVFFRDLLQRVATVPGVAAVGINTGMHPFGGWGMQVEVAGGSQDTRPVGFSQVNPGYLKIFGFRLLAGRLPSEHEVAAQQRIAVVNDAFVKRYLSGRSALGAIVRVPRLARDPYKLPETGFEIAGVVSNVLNEDPKEGVQPEMFVPYTVLGRADNVSVLAAVDPASLSKTLAAEVYAIDPDQPVTDVRTVQETLERWAFSGPRFNLILFGVFAALGLILATVGVYGVISNTVARRTQEIGLRLALGAAFTDVTWLVLRRGMILIAIGLAFGLAATLAAGRLLRSYMSAVAEFDITALAAVSAVMVLSGAIACFWPAQRAARVDPSIALRTE